MPLVTDIELRVHPERCWLGVPEADSAAAGRRWKAASRILCPLVGKIELQSDWLDLRDQLPAADAERTKPFHQRLQAMLNRMSGNAAKVIVAPTQWLCAVLGQLRARGSSGTEPGSLDQVFPELRAVIAIASGFDGLLPLLHLQLSETDRDLVVLGGYEAVPRGLVGIQGHPYREAVSLACRSGSSPRAKSTSYVCRAVMGPSPTEPIVDCSARRPSPIASSLACHLLVQPLRHPALQEEATANVGD